MNEWPEVEFQKLASNDRWSFTIGPFGSKVTTGDYRESGVPFIRGVNLSPGVFLDDEFVYIDEQKAAEVESACAISGDLVFTRKGTIGQVSMIPYESRYKRYVISGSQMKARLDPCRACPRFYYYWFRSPAGQHALLTNASAVGVPSIPNSLTTLRKINVPIPPLREQQSIAVLLGALDDKIAVNNRIADATLELGLTRYRGMASVSTGWKLRTAKEVAKWQSGGTPKTSEPSYWDGDIPWISARSLKSPWIFESDKCVTSLGAANGTRMVSAGTVIFVVRGSSLDSEFRVGLTMREVTFGQDCKALIPREGVDSHTLFIALKANSSKILKLVDHAGHGAGRLSTDLIENFEIALPDGANVGDVTQTLKPLVEAGTERKRENRALSELRDTLLPKLMSGEIRIRDAEKVVEDAV